MNWFVRGLVACLLGVMFVVVGGCAFASYSYRGKHDAPLSTVHAGPFVLQAFTFKTDAVHSKSLDRWCISSWGTTLRKKDIEKTLLACYPSLFATSTNACPVSVTMRVMTSKEDIYAGMLMFICSVGTLPMWCTYDDDCEVRVRIGDGDQEIVCPVEKVGYKSCRWETLYTPIGLFQSTSRDGYNGECRFGAAWEIQPSAKCYKDLEDVFCIEVAHAIAGALSRCDPDNLKRAVLYQSLNGADK